MVACCEELSPINMHENSIEWSCGLAWQMKYISLPPESVSIPYQARWWLSEWNRLSNVTNVDQVTNEMSLNVLKNLYLYFKRFIANKIGRLLTLGRIFSTQTLKSSPASCMINFEEVHYDFFYLETIISHICISGLLHLFTGNWKRMPPITISSKCS